MRHLLLVICLAAVPLGALATTTSSATAQSSAKQVDFEAMVVERLDLHHMSAEDMSAVLGYRFRGQLWTRVEGLRNAVLVCGPEKAVSAAGSIAARLDVPRPAPKD